MLTQTNADTVTVTETLASGVSFAGTGAGDALEFNLTETSGVTLSNFTSGFKAGPSPDSASTFGSFMYSVTCDYTGGGCHGGKASNSSGPLTFTVSDPSGLLISDFTANGSGFYFAADVLGTTGNTGNVAALGPITTAATPEPSSLLLLGTGISGIAMQLRRRRRSA